MKRRKTGFDLKRYYTLLLQAGLILTLFLFIIASNINLASFDSSIYDPVERELPKFEEIPPEIHIEKPPAPPRPQVPVPVPDDFIIDDVDIDLYSYDHFDDRFMSPPDDPNEDEEKVFEIVENMPELIGGMASIQKEINYPEVALRAGIEGLVQVQFIVNKQGEVEDPQVIRGIGGGADEEALRAVKKAKFRPGLQRGRPVRVQYSLPVYFKLQN